MPFALTSFHEGDVFALGFALQEKATLQKSHPMKWANIGKARKAM